MNTLKSALVALLVTPVMALAQTSEPIEEPPGADPSNVGPEMVDPVRPPPAVTEEEPGTRELRGRLGDVDKRRGRFALELSARRDVKVTRDGRSASFRELEEGDSVRAVLDEASGRVIEIDAVSPERRRQIRERARDTADLWE